MKVNLMRHESVMDGVLVPVNDESIGRIKKLKWGEVYDFNVSEPQDYALQKKLFKLIGFAFEHTNFPDSPIQRQKFRDDLTVLAGYYDKVYHYDGSLRLVPKSLKYSKMPPDQRREFYDAILNVIWEKIMKKSDPAILQELMRF